MKAIKYLVFSIFPILLIGSCTDSTLSFNQMVEITRKESLQISKEAKFYEASSTNSVERVKAVFRGSNNSTIEILCNNKGELKSTIIDSPFLEDEVIHLPIKMTLEEAEEGMIAAGYGPDWSEVVVRRPLGPEFTEALYIFTTTNAYVSVNTITGEVTKL